MESTGPRPDLVAARVATSDFVNQRASTSSRPSTFVPSPAARARKPTISPAGNGHPCQRVKIAKELRQAKQPTMYVLDEPTTGLHMDDTDTLLRRDPPRRPRRDVTA